MTRETKIGLLVGLAFIIVIGILLSDHLTSATEPPQAQLAQAGGNVRSAVTVPGAPAAPTVAPAPQQQAHVTPQQPVPTKEELTPKQPPVEIVQIGSGAGQDHPKVTVEPPHTPITQNTHDAGAKDPASLSAEQGVTGMDSNSPPTARPGDAKIPGSLTKIAESMGEELVPADGSPKPTQAGNTTLTQLPAGAKTYKVEPGDNLARIAQKTMGAPSKANINAIIAANASLQQNPNLVVAGRTYVIPGLSAATVATNAPVAPLTPSTPPAKVVAPVIAERPTGPEYFYTVKAGDSLTKIAVTQLGTPAAVEALKDLNKEALKGGETIHPNMKLRLPAKPLASAS